MTDWQPIETAPKNGEFLGYDSYARKMGVCRMGELDERPSAVPVQFDRAYGPLEDEFGYDWDSITHWQPLPEPPKDS